MIPVFLCFRVEYHCWFAQTLGSSQRDNYYLSFLLQKLVVRLIQQVFVKFNVAMGLYQVT